MNNMLKRFEIWFAILPEILDSHVQHGTRPVLVVSNDMANRHSPIVTVVPLTSQKKKPLPTHVTLTGCGLTGTSQALCEQIMALDTSRLTKRVGYVNDPELRAAIHHGLAVQLAMAS